MKISSEAVKTALDKAYLEASSNAQFGDGFNRGVTFAVETLNVELEKFKADLIGKLDDILNKTNENFARAWDEDLSDASDCLILEDLDEIEYNGWFEDLLKFRESLEK